jgi:hypothetical protein
VEGSCEHGIEASGSIKCWGVLEWLHNGQPLKKGSALLDKARLSPVSNTRKIVMQSNCNSIQKEGHFNTDTEIHSDEDVFYSQVGLCLF